MIAPDNKTTDSELVDAAKRVIELASPIVQGSTIDTEIREKAKDIEKDAIQLQQKMLDLKGDMNDRERILETRVKVKVDEYTWCEETLYIIEDLLYSIERIISGIRTLPLQNIPSKRQDISSKRQITKHDEYKGVQYDKRTTAKLGNVT